MSAMDHKRGEYERKESSSKLTALVVSALVPLSLVNQTVFRERACASERGRGGRENTVWPNSPGFRGHDKILS